MADPEDVLPSFERPPVTEVAISTYFRSLPPPALLQIAHFWDAVRDHFPNYEEHPPFEAPIEQFDAMPRALALPQIEFSTGAPPPPRLWFLNPDGDELLQVQRDWFGCNWRKVSPQAEYGRWGTRWEAFERWFHMFEQHVTRHLLKGDVEHRQCEVTYVNHIEPNGVWKHHGELAEVITLAAVPSDPQVSEEKQVLQAAEAINVVARYPIKDESGVPIGRLHIGTGEAFKKADNTPVIQLTLTARGRPEGEGLEGVRRFAERAHRCIVHAFCAVTTERMHALWGRKG